MCCWFCRCCCEDFCDDYCDYDCDCFDWDDFKQLLREWREDYTLILTSHFSRIHARLVSQQNAYITMFFIGCFEFSVWVLMIIAMVEIITKPNMQFDLDLIQWDNIECDMYQKRYLRKCFRMSAHLLPISATLMSLGTFFCCYLCKPPYGLSIGIFLRYPFAITLTVYSWFMYNKYAYFEERHCVLPSSTLNADHVVQRMNDIYLFLYRLCIYYTLILVFMTPTLLLVYYVFFYSYALISRISYHIKVCCMIHDRGRNNNHNNNAADNGYLDKMERNNLVSKSVSDCPICMSTDIELILTKGCKHGCCSDCLYQYLVTDLKNIGAYPRKCFMNNCEILLNYTNVEYALIDNNELEEYDKMLIMASTNGNNESIACPLCNAVMLKPRDVNNQGLMQCVNENCKCDLCSKCGVLYHLNRSCEEYMNEIRTKTSGADEAFDELTKAKKWCKCPNCGLVVERSEGCYHMTHYGCPGGGIERRTDFCYYCATKLMKKNGEGWRYELDELDIKHFENGVYAECINVGKIETMNSENDMNSIDNSMRDDDVQINIDEMNDNDVFL